MEQLEATGVRPRQVRCQAALTAELVRRLILIQLPEAGGSVACEHRSGYWEQYEIGVFSASIECLRFIAEEFWADRARVQSRLVPQVRSP
jgi:hypothetical protein